jgi:hypothetical protein
MAAPTYGIACFFLAVLGGEPPQTPPKYYLI